MEELYRKKVTNLKYQHANIGASQSSSSTELEMFKKSDINVKSLDEPKTTRFSTSPKIKAKNIKNAFSDKENSETREDESDSPTTIRPVYFESRFDELDWAKRVFYTSVERIFPGFRKSSENRKISRNLYSVRIRSSLSLCMILLGSYYFNIPWGICFLISVNFKFRVLKAVHGGLLIGCSILYFIINFVRLNVGYRGNYNDDAKELGIYWIMSALIQVPLITFLLMTDYFSPAFVPLSTITDSISALLLTVELLIGFLHLNSIISGELQVAHIAHDAWKTMIRKSSSFPNQPGEEYFMNWLDVSSEEELSPVIKHRKSSVKYMKNSSVGSLDYEPPKTRIYHNPEHTDKFFPRLKSKDTVGKVFAKAKKSSSRKRVKKLWPKKSASQMYLTELKHGESRRRSDSGTMQDLSSQRRIIRKGSEKRETIEKNQGEYQKETSPARSEFLEFILVEEDSDLANYYSDKQSLHLTSTKKPVRFKDSSKQDKTLPVQKSLVIDAKKAKSKTPVATGISIPKKPFVRDEINLPVKKVSSDVISEANTASKDSLPFSNLEEGEAAYLLDVLSDCDNDQNLVPRYKSSCV